MSPFSHPQILNYHPLVQAQYLANTCRLSPLTSQFDMNNEDVRRQFMLAEQRSAGFAPHGIIGDWKQPQPEQLLGLHYPGLVHQQQLPAYRPLVDAAVALQEQQVHEAMAMYQHGANGASLDYYLAAANVSGTGHDHHAHAAAVAAAAAAMAAASGLYPEPNMAFC